MKYKGYTIEKIKPIGNNKFIVVDPLGFAVAYVTDTANGKSKIDFYASSLAR